MNINKEQKNEEIINNLFLLLYKKGLIKEAQELINKSNKPTKIIKELLCLLRVSNPIYL